MPPAPAELHELDRVDGRRAGGVAAPFPYGGGDHFVGLLTEVDVGRGFG